MKSSGLLGVSMSDLRLMANLGEKELEDYIQQLLSQEKIFEVDRESRTFVHGTVIEELRRKALKILDKFHKENPLKVGMARQELMSRLSSSLSSKLFNILVQDLTTSNSAVQEKEVIRLSGHSVALGADEEDLSRRIERAYLESGLQPPYFRDMMSSLGQNSSNAKEILMHMLKEGILVKVKEDLYFHRGVIDDLKQKLVDYLRTEGEITTPQFKEMTGVSRKYTIPLIEFFDATRVTIRVGDTRRLREG